MRLRLDRLSAAVRSRRTRSMILLVAAIPLWLFGLISFGMVAMAASEPRPTDWGAAGFCAAFGGVVPCIGAALLMFARHRYDKGTRELQALFTEAGADGRVDRPALEAKGWSRERADTVLLDALAHGLLTDEAGFSIRPDAPPPPGAFSGLPPPAPLPSAPWSAPPTTPSAPVQGPPLPSVQPQGLATPPPQPYAHHATPAPSPSPVRGALVPDAIEDALAVTRAARPRSDRPGTPPTSVLSGRVLKGTYLVEEQLGQGGMGAVFAARHLRTGRRYAVKTLLSSERFSPEAILRFEREARAASAIGHAGIVAVHDFDRTEDGVHFLVMDLLVGETLEARLGRHGRLTWSEARRPVLETCEALEAAHRAGILHRDLKPANVFLAQLPGAAERAVLVDFGLAKPIEDSAAPRVTSTGAVVGTALYMSPEQARGDRLDVRSDVYGVAAVAYEMLTGVPPFLGPSAIAVMTMVLAEQPVPPSLLARGVPPELDAALLAALAKSADERPADVRAFATLLAAVPPG